MTYDHCRNEKEWEKKRQPFIKHEGERKFTSVKGLNVKKHLIHFYITVWKTHAWNQ